MALIGSPAPAAQDEPEEEAPSLAITQLELLDRRGGYPIPADSFFYPGEKVYLSFFIGGYKVSDDYRMHVTWKVEALGPGGTPFATAEGGEFAVEVAPQDENWEPAVHYSAELPSHAPGGIYTLAVEIVDRLADAKVAREVPIDVRGESVEISDKLSLRNFAFRASEDGPALDKPVFGPGGSVWASFQITGYKTGEDNVYDVSSQLTVVDAEGKQMYTFAPEGEKGAPFYPRLWLPGSFRLDLDPDIPSGEYSLVLTIQDNISGLSHTERKQIVVK